MNDRELIYLAAKAAGMTVEWDHYAGSGENGAMVTSEGMVWMPFEDDGDALRLAVKLNLEVVCDDTTEHMPFAYASLMATDLRVFEPVVACPYAATRRAIARAAAEIGKAAP